MNKKHVAILLDIQDNITQDQINMLQERILELVMQETNPNFSIREKKYNPEHGGVVICQP